MKEIARELEQEAIRRERDQKRKKVRHEVSNEQEGVRLGEKSNERVRNQW